MIIKDRLLFLKYALPCANTLVKRGTVSKEYVDKLIKEVARNKVPVENAEKIFKVATSMCFNIAEKMKKDSVDSEVIRQYFLFEHDKVVDDRFKLMGDFNPIDCKTYAGKVLSVHDKYAIVETPLGKRKYKTVFAKDVKKNDYVVVHFDYIVEKISSKIAEKMNEAK